MADTAQQWHFLSPGPNAKMVKGSKFFEFRAVFLELATRTFEAKKLRIAFASSFWFYVTLK